ncbi:hypothetical protein GMMP15_2050002 [Candidatus Magnetomoraceae bacterium gMMP-15]
MANTSKKKGKIYLKDEKEDISKKRKIYPFRLQLDFTEHQQLFQKLENFAKENFRTISEQILFYLAEKVKEIARYEKIKLETEMEEADGSN